VGGALVVLFCASCSVFAAFVVATASWLSLSFSPFFRSFTYDAYEWGDKQEQGALNWVGLD